jgi:hypothetical protein
MLSVDVVNVLSWSCWIVVVEYDWLSVDGWVLVEEAVNVLAASSCWFEVAVDV